MEVDVRELTKTFGTLQGNVTALEKLSFHIRPGEFYTLLGPSGCGKSTTLRCIAGLERPDAGEIVLGGRMVAGPGVWTAPNERPIGMVFQSYAIWPHMTVFGNVEFPLRQTRSWVNKTERKKRVTEALNLVQMAEYADRPAPFLSGGQQQRVALARALVSRPEVLLLDEPLSNLDAKLREELRIEIKDLTKRLGITAVYVTHDQIEALAMSDRIAVMHHGQILQEGPPKEIYLRPANSFVARFVGQVNFFEGTVGRGAENGLGVVETSFGRLICGVPSGIAAGAAVSVAVRPERLHATAQRADGAGGNVLEGELEKATFLGDAIDCQVRVGAQCVRAKLVQIDDFTPGQRIYLRFGPEACVVLPGRAAAEAIPAFE